MTEPHQTPAGGGALTATQAALAAEHAAVYGYGVVGAWAGDERREAVRQVFTAHRAQRDALSREVRELGEAPEASAAGYALPFEVSDAAGALALAAELEDRVAGAYGDLVRATEGERRRAAADALRDAAVRAARWRGRGVPFPGLAEYAGDAGTAEGQG